MPPKVRVFWNRSRHFHDTKCCMQCSWPLSLPFLTAREGGHQKCCISCLHQTAVETEHTAGLSMHLNLWQQQLRSKSIGDTHTSQLLRLILTAAAVFTGVAVMAYGIPVQCDGAIIAKYETLGSWISVQPLRSLVYCCSLRQSATGKRWSGY